MLPRTGPGSVVSLASVSSVGTRGGYHEPVWLSDSSVSDEDQVDQAKLRRLIASLKQELRFTENTEQRAALKSRLEKEQAVLYSKFEVMDRSARRRTSTNPLPGPILPPAAADDEKLKTYKRRLTEAKEQNEVLKRDLEAKEETYHLQQTALTSRVEEIEGENTVLQTRMLAAESQVGDKQHEIEQLQDLLITSGGAPDTNSVALLHNVLEKIGVKKTNLDETTVHETLKIVEAAISGQREELEAARGNLRDVELIRAQAVEAAARLQQEVTDLTLSSQVLRRNESNLMHQIDSLRQEVEGLQASCTDIESSLVASRKTHERDQSNLRDTIAEQRESLKTASEEHSKLSRDLTSVSVQLDETLHKKGLITAKVTTLQQEVTRLKSAEIEVGLRSDETTRELDTMRQAKMELEQVAEGFKETAEQLQEENDVIKLELRAQDAVLKETTTEGKTHADGLERELEVVTKRRDELEEEVSTLRRVIKETMNSEIVTLQQKLTKIPVLNEQIEQLTAELTTLRPIVEKTTADFDEANRQLQILKNEKEEKIPVLNEQIEQLTAEITTLRPLRHELSKLTADFDEAKRQLQILKDEKAVVEEEEIPVLNEQIEQLTAEITTLRPLRHELSKLTTNFDEAKRQEIKIPVLNEQVKQLTAEITTLRPLRHELSSLTAQLQLMKDEKAAIEEEAICKLNAERLNAEELQAENDVLASQLREAGSETSETAVKMIESQEEVVRLQKQLQDINEQTVQRVKTAREEVEVRLAAQLEVEEELSQVREEKIALGTTVARLEKARRVEVCEPQAVTLEQHKHLWDLQGRLVKEQQETLRWKKQAQENETALRSREFTRPSCPGPKIDVGVSKEHSKPTRSTKHDGERRCQTQRGEVDKKPPLFPGRQPSASPATDMHSLTNSAEKIKRDIAKIREQVADSCKSARSRSSSVERMSSTARKYLSSMPRSVPSHTHTHTRTLKPWERIATTRCSDASSSTPMRPRRTPASDHR